MAGKNTVRKGGIIRKKTVINTVSYENVCPVWVFDRIDRNGKFAFDTGRDDFDHKEILDKMISYSGMTWAQLERQTHDGGRSKHHYLDAESLSREALDRIRKMQIDEESDQIFSIALRNRLRVIGLRDKDRFHVLWYDPEHEVCPSSKKHT